MVMNGSTRLLFYCKRLKWVDINNLATSEMGRKSLEVYITSYTTITYSFYFYGSMVNPAQSGPTNCPF
ncbi:hypothetical protein HanRHA438_Chr04g0165781 [Helianthus annuus]|nr:hypothetical protein HanRHA438_Chr04g0165781 [Helianthus annuus]